MAMLKSFSVIIKTNFSSITNLSRNSLLHCRNHVHKIIGCSFTTQTEDISRSKIYDDVSEAVKDITDGSKLLFGGFGVCGMPENLIQALIKHEAENFTIVANDVGGSNHGLGLLLQEHKIERIIASYVEDNAEFEDQFSSGKLKVELVSQGTLSERIRAGGAGIPAFFTSFETKIPNNTKDKKNKTKKEEHLFDGKSYIMEEAITGDFALIKAWKADLQGNLLFKKSTRSFNPIVAKAAKTTIAEVEEIVALGKIPPDHVHLSGIFVDRIIQFCADEKRIEKARVFKKEVARNKRIAKRVAAEFKEGMYVNLGNGMPMLAAKYAPQEISLFLLSENGVLGLGPCCNFDADFEDEAFALVKGACYLNSDDSLAMIRGGHIDLRILSALEVSQFGDIANWNVPKKLETQLDTTLDLIPNPATRVIVCMEHTAKDGSIKILENCTLPVSGKQIADMIITEKAVFQVDHKLGLTLIEVAEGLTVEDVRECTGCNFASADELKCMQQVPDVTFNKSRMASTEP